MSGIKESSNGSFSLKDAGFTRELSRDPALTGKVEPARVSFTSRNKYKLITAKGEKWATLTGSLRREGKVPLVGDWVAVDTGANPAIRSLLKRKNLLKRGAAGGRKREGEAVPMQNIAANIDKIFILCGLDRDYNPPRIARYTVLSELCGATPIVILNKADLCDEARAREEEIKGLLPSVEVKALSAAEGDVGWIKGQINPGETICLLGSSGAGKSTLINALIGGEAQKTAAVSEALGKGRHTTTHRELFILPSGGIIIDNPGMREITLPDEALEDAEVFSIIDELARGCKFRDCKHVSEPGCSVLDAVQAGEIAREAVEKYSKLKGQEQ